MVGVFGFVRNCQTVFQSGCIVFAFPPAMYEHFCYSTSLPELGIVSVPDFGHSNRCIWYLIVVLICISFICLFSICISSLVRSLLRSLAHLKILCALLLSFKSSLYILDNSLYQMSFLQIFSPSLWLVFLLS